VTLALWAAESAAPVTLAWLADRLLTTTTTILDIIEHPRASRVLRIDGDLDDVDAPLTMTVLADGRKGIASSSAGHRGS